VGCPVAGNERQLLIEKCGELLHRVLVEIRALTWSWEPGNERLIEELADLAHNIPLFMVGRDDTVPKWLRAAVVEYARKRWPQTNPEETWFVQLLDMDEATFADQVRRYNWNQLASAKPAD
jgi:hypothetical protein